MEYNTQRKDIVFLDYGRTVYKMIEHAKSLESREERNKAAETIVKVMVQVNPRVKDCNDYQHRVWDHLMMLSGWELDVDMPYAMEKKDMDKVVPERVGVVDRKAVYPHYGKVLEGMVEKIAAMDDGEEREKKVAELLETMKLSYMQWNSEDVEDNVIKKQVEELSKGMIKVAQDYVIETDDSKIVRAEGEKKQKKKKQKKK